MRSAPHPTLFQAALGERWDQLAPAVRRLHEGPAIDRFRGRARIERGTGMTARLAGRLFGFPRSGNDVPVALTVTRSLDGEHWHRDFAGRHMRSRLAPSDRPYHYRERLRGFTFEQELPVEGGAMHLVVRRGWLFGLPLPEFLLPVTVTREYEADGRFRFDIRIEAPLGRGLLVHYRGWLAPDYAGGA